MARLIGTCSVYNRSLTDMPEHSVHRIDHSNNNSVNQTQVVVEIHVNRAIQRIDYGERDSAYSVDAIIPTTTDATAPPLGVTFSHEELPTVVKLFPIRYNDLFSSDILGNCDLNSIMSAIGDFIPEPTMKDAVLHNLDGRKKLITEYFMKFHSLRADGEGKPGLLSVVIPVQVVKVIETFDHYLNVEDGHSHDIIDNKYLQTPEMDQFLSRRYPSFFSLLKMKKFDGASDLGECLICLQDYDENNDGDAISLAELPCTHVFHTRCIIRTLDAKSRCPICRYHFRVQPLHKCSCPASPVS